MTHLHISYVDYIKKHTVVRIHAAQSPEYYIRYVQA